MFDWYDREWMEQVERVYGDQFPLEVRLQLADWIEERFQHPIEVKQEDPLSQNHASQVAQVSKHCAEPSCPT